MRLKYAKLNMVRLLSSLLASVLLMTLLAVLFAPSVFADETTPPEGDFEIIPDYDPDADEIDWESVATSGKCGEHLTWSYSGSTLTITGRGDMTDFPESEKAPWYPLRNVIHRVVLTNELTSIGRLAFYNCKNLKAINLPDDVRRIGNYAFAGCEKLTLATFGTKLGHIGAGAFYGCLRLSSIRLPNTVTYIGDQAFYRCESLITIKLPDSLSAVGNSVFAYCKNLIRAEISARIGTIPEWTFYGCERLTVVILPPTLGAIENYAFKQCEGLTTVYFDGKESNKTQILQGIEKDNPLFSIGGVVGNSTLGPTVVSGKYFENENGTVTQENTTVRHDDNLTLISKVEHTHTEGTTQGGSYTVDITVSVDHTDAWDATAELVKETLKQLNEQYTEMMTKQERVDVVVYVKTEGTVDEEFVQEMAGRDVKMTVVMQNGSEFRVDCSDLNKEELSGDYNYSYSVDSATQESRDELGTDDCFKLTFEESAKINAEVVIPLPENKGNSNAFLYQVERDGTHTRLQAVAVDNDGNAHFYLGAVDKDTEYVIGVNVPDERTDDVIYPDELLELDSDTQSAIIRLEKIDYVITGRESSWGLGAMQVTWIMLAVIAVCIVVVGVIMAIWNKRRLERGYVPEIDYEAEEM